MPRVITTSRPFPCTTAAPCTSASLATLVGLPKAVERAAARSNLSHASKQLLVHRRARALLADEVGGAEHDAVAHHAGESAGDPVRLGKWLDQCGERVDQSAVAVGGERVLGVDPDPVGHHGAGLAQHRCLQSGAPTSMARVKGCSEVSSLGVSATSPNCTHAVPAWCVVAPVTEKVADGVAQDFAQLGRRNIGEGVAGHEDPPQHRTERRRHADTVSHREPLIGEHPLEAGLQVLVLRVVLLLDGAPRTRLDFSGGEGRSCGGPASGRRSCPAGRPKRRRGLLLAELIQRIEAELVQAQVERHQDVFLAGEVVIERRLGNPQLLGDLPERRLVEALLDEQVERHVEDALAGAQGLGGILRSRTGASATAVLVFWSTVPILLDGR